MTGLLVLWRTDPGSAVARRGGDDRGRPGRDHPAVSLVHDAAGHARRVPRPGRVAGLRDGQVLRGRRAAARGALVPIAAIERDGYAAALAVVVLVSLLCWQRGRTQDRGPARPVPVTEPVPMAQPVPAERRPDPADGLAGCGAPAGMATERTLGVTEKLWTGCRTMIGSDPNLVAIVVPIVALITLAFWLGLCFWAGSHPFWRHHQQAVRQQQLDSPRSGRPAPAIGHLQGLSETPGGAPGAQRVGHG